MGEWALYLRVLRKYNHQVTAKLMGTANRSFETFAEFRTASQTLGGVYLSLEQIPTFREHLEILTALTTSTFYSELLESQLADQFPDLAIYQATQ